MAKQRFQSSKTQGFPTSGKSGGDYIKGSPTKTIGPMSATRKISNGGLNRGEVDGPGRTGFNHLGRAPYHEKDK